MHLALSRLHEVPIGAQSLRLKLVEAKEQHLDSEEKSKVNKSFAVEYSKRHTTNSSELHV